MRIAHVSLVRPTDRPDPDALLSRWPTLGAVAEAVAAAGHEVMVVQAFHRDCTFRRAGVTYRFVDCPALPGRSSGVAPWRIARAVRKSGAELIHLNGLDVPLHTRWLSRLGPPVLVQDHASSARGRRALRRFGLANVAGAAFTASGQADPFRDAGILPPATPVFEVPESSSRFTPGDRRLARARSGLAGKPALLWVGRLTPDKDPLVALAAIERLVDTLPELHLTFCFTEHPLLDRVRARIEASPALVGRVTLRGAVPHTEVETLLRAADLYLSCSHREGSGYALNEALACGTPAVVSDIPSFRQLTGDGAVATLFPVGDADALAAALTLAARDIGEARRLAVRAHFERNLSFAAIGRRLDAVYRALTGR